MMMMMMMMMMMNCFCDMVDRRKAFSLIFDWDHYQRFSPSPWYAANRIWTCVWILGLDFAEWSSLREKYSKFFWSVFSTFGLNTERHGVMRYSVQMRGNTDHKNSEYGHFSRSGCTLEISNTSWRHFLFPFPFYFIGFTFLLYITFFSMFLSILHQEVFGAKVSSQWLSALFILPNLCLEIQLINNIARKCNYFSKMTFYFLAKTNLCAFYKSDWKINTLQVELV